jgi:hypothetical protein
MKIEHIDFPAQHSVTIFSLSLIYITHFCELLSHLCHFEDRGEMESWKKGYKIYNHFESHFCIIYWDQKVDKCLLKCVYDTAICLA